MQQLIEQQKHVEKLVDQCKKIGPLNIALMRPALECLADNQARLSAMYLGEIMALRKELDNVREVLNNGH